jgi:hypothetical protein
LKGWFGLVAGIQLAVALPCLYYVIGNSTNAYRPVRRLEPQG